ncbi:MAG: TonB-dependent receptor [Candidatus Saganbacteria bacterium]|nr:TonB-dependent receptor [Candidatus Saganbacteria bacterium]
MFRLSGYQIIRVSGLFFCSILLASACLAQYPVFYGEEVVVTALRIPRLRSSVPWNTRVITRQEIENSSAKKLGDIIRTVPGLSVKANGGLSSQISTRLRGSNSQQVLVLLNGHRINSPSLGLFDLGDILLTDVEKIEVVKGPLSPAYGADAVGGVINVITRAESESPQLKAVMAYGESNTRHYSVSGSGQHYFFSLASLRSNGFRANSDYQAEDYNVRLTGGLGTARVEAGLKRYKAEKGSPGSLDFSTPQARQTDDNDFYDLLYALDELGLKMTLSQAVLDQRYENPTWGQLSTHRTVSTSYDLQQVISWFPSQTWLLGLEMRSDQSESTNSGTHDLENKAVFLQDEIEASSGLKLVLGGREDISSVYGGHFSPRLGCVWRPWLDTIVRASWGSSFKAPTIDDLFWTRTTEPGWPSGIVTTEGNPALLPETSDSLDLSLEKRLDFATTARLSLFKSRINDMIRWSNTSTSTRDSYWTPRNISDAAIEGIEFELSRQINDSLKGFVNLTYELAKDEATGNFLDYAPQNQYNAGLTYDDRTGLTSDIKVKYVGERFADQANTIKLEAYSEVDLTMTKKFGSLIVKGEIENLFDAAYAESYGFTDIYPMPGRRYNIGVSIEL